MWLSCTSRVITPIAGSSFLPIKMVSTGVLWRGVDAGLIDGTVNAVGLVVRGWSAVLRRLQTGSVRAYAMSLFVGVVVIVGYYLSAWVR